MKQHQRKDQYTLAELSDGLDVTIQGDPHCLVKGICTLNQSRAGHITFLMNPLYKKYLTTTEAAAVILNASDAKDCPVNALITRDPYYVYAKIAAFFDPRSTPPQGIHSSVVVGQGCSIATSASIGPNCVIGDGVKIEEGVVIGPGCIVGEFSELGENSCLDAAVTLYDRVKLGKNVRIASGTVIGSDGFGIAKHKGTWHKVPQLGGVVIEDDVEIGSNCSIDRGAIENTVIGAGAKLDNLIQIGHNVKIGENTAIAGCVGISGSTVVGKNCLIGGAAGLAGHLVIADNVMITGGAEITKSIREPGIYSSGVGGVVTNLEWRKNSARLHRLDQLVQRVKALEAALHDLIERKVT